MKNYTSSELFPILVIVLVLSSALVILNVAGVSSSFNNELNLSPSSPDDSTDPQIAVNGSKIYVVHEELQGGDVDIIIRNSTNGGVSFQNRINVTNSLSTESQDVQIAFSNDHVFLVWEEVNADGDGGDDIFFAQSDISAASPSFTLTNLSNGADWTGDSSDARVAANGTNVYVVWRDQTDDPEGDIYYRYSNDNGDNWTPALNADPTQLSTSTTFDSDEPQVVAEGNSAYVVWRDERHDGIDSVNFAAIFNAGATVNSENDLGTSHTTATPQLAVDGGLIHVVFENATTREIAYRTVTNGSTLSFSPALTSIPTVLSTEADTDNTDDPQIKADKGRVNVLWEQDVGATWDIAFTNSTDNGASFNDAKTLASDVGATPNPRMAINGTNVYVVWQTGGDVDLFHKTSTKLEFTEFESVSDTVENDGEAARDAAIGAGADRSFVVWEDLSTDTNNPEILFNFGEPSITVGFTDTSDENTEKFRLSEKARVRVVDAASDTTGSADTISVTVTSSTDSDGISVTLTETGGATDIFTGDITFSTGASNDSTDVLQASTGDTITAVFNSKPGTTEIYPRTVELSSNVGYSLESEASVTVTDQNSNKNSGAAETIDVTISSSRANTSITLTLTETGINTGVFGGSSDVNFVFMNNHAAFPLDRNITITQEDTSENDSATEIDTTTINVATTTDAGPATITLTETGINTAVFTGIIKFISSASSGNNIQASDGDFVTITNIENLIARAIITPNSDTSNGGLQVLVDGSGSDTITASFSGSTDTAGVAFSTGESGGGGGGTVRPALVLDAVAGLAIFTGGGGADRSAPTMSIKDVSRIVDVPKNIQTVIDNFDPQKPIESIVDETFDFPLAIDEKGFALSGYHNTIKTNKIKPGEPVNLKTTFFENSKLEHVSLHFNLRNVNPEIQNSDTKIIYNVDKPIEIVDPHGFIESVTPILVEDGIKTKVDFEIVFAKEMETSDLIIRTWDENRNSADTIVADAFEISNAPEIQVESSVKEVELDEIPLTADTPKKEEVKVPEWIKMNAKWWTEDNITDTEFTKGIEFLIVDNIIALPESEVVPEPEEEVDPEPGVEVDPEPEDEKEVRPPTIQKMPNWVKNNAKWWSDGHLTDEDFVNAIKFLVEKRIIEVN